MVKYYEIIYYVPSRNIYKLDNAMLSYSKAVHYCSCWKHAIKDKDGRYILQQRWLLEDGLSSPEVIWEFKNNDKMTKAFEDAQM